MASVDNRVVKMEFDNRSFQQKIGATTESLKKLKDSLNFSKAGDSLNEVSKSANNFNLNGITNGVQTATNSFSVLAGAAAVALGGIALKAASVGAGVIKAFTIDPVRQGFQEYETNMQSIQTILANTATKGTNLDQVSEALDRLNEYSDQTIYNFGQMAKNIGTFTAAGVDLDTSVASIKGIANLAALSGSSAEQASTAMYQLSQAISTGSLKLMDWNSVTNAGMGGEAFKTTLFETAKAMGTLNDIPLDQTLGQWEDAGNNFRESLQDGWITSDVLTTALSSFTGDMNEEMLIAKGFSQQQATLLMEQAARAKSAATEVKTFTQLIGTVKESIGTGFADSFKLIIGNFTEAKALFTQINNVISGIVGQSAKARNDVLTIWRFLGGREVLIEGLKNAFTALGKVITTIKSAFDAVFPRNTGVKIAQLTLAFKNFTEKLILSESTLGKLKSIMQGVFSVFAIVYAVVKGVFSVFASLFSVLGDLAGKSNILGFFAFIGDAVFRLKEALVDGKGIANFFKVIADGLQSLVGGTLGKGIDAVSESTERLGERFSFAGKMGGAFAGLFKFLEDIVTNATNLFAGLTSAIGESLKNVKNIFSNAFTKNEFDGVIDGLNVALFGGILLLIRKFINTGLKLDLGNGLFSNISGMFDQLGDTLKAFELKLKAEAIMKIAIAMAVLTASLVVLAMIDPAKLAGALIAVAAGFAILTTTLTSLGKVADDLAGGLKLNLLVLAMLGLAVTMIVLSIAVKMFSTMSLSDIVKGIAAMAIILVAFTESAKRMPKTSDIIGMSIGIFFLGAAVKKMAGAVISLSKLSWSELVKGLSAFTAIMLLLTQVMEKLPKDLGNRLKGMLLFSFAIGNIAITIKMLGGMDIPSLAQGLIAFALIMETITKTVNNLPKNMVSVSATLFALGVALLAITFAMTVLGAMPIMDITKGVIGLGAILLLLTIAMNSMAANAPMTTAGVLAILAISVGLYILTQVIKQMSSISWGDLLKGMAMLAILIAGFAIAAVALTPALPALAALGISLLLIGAGLALVGVGAFLLANAVFILVNAGRDGIKLIVELLRAVISLIPEFVAGLISGLLDGAKDFIGQLPQLIGLLGGVIVALIEKLREILPSFLVLVGELITGVVNLLVEKIPEFYAAGWKILIGLLDGIRKNLPIVVILVGEIIVNFLRALSTEIPRIVAAGVDLLVKLIEGISSVMFIVGFAAMNILTSFIEGLTAGVQDLITAGTDLIVAVITGIGDSMDRIITAGVDTFQKFLDGLEENISKLTTAAFEFILTFLTELTAAVELYLPQIRQEGINLMEAIINGMTGGLLEKAQGVIGKVTGFFGDIIGAAKGALDSKSPSKVFRNIGRDIIAGLVIGIDDHSSAIESTENFAGNVTKAMSKALTGVTDSLTRLDEFNPVITPVLDLTAIESGSARLNRMFATPKIDTSSSFGRASAISISGMAAANQTAPVMQPVQTINEVKFEQIINSPLALNTAEIYRNTKTQISMAKEELKIK